ncbi:uncharacterized protein UHOD_11931 [Ustilago sp. UG-2017b]|nr:uncharacterized protein UHOD_11931 [Ustilago sp. UG-2017b]
MYPAWDADASSTIYFSLLRTTLSACLSGKAGVAVEWEQKYRSQPHESLVPGGDSSLSQVGATQFLCHELYADKLDISEPSIHTIAKTIGEHKGRLRLRDERECAHRLERLPDRRKGGRMSARERETNTGWETLEETPRFC